MEKCNREQLSPFPHNNSPVEHPMKWSGCRYKSKKRKRSFTQHGGKVWYSSWQPPVEGLCVNGFEKLLDKLMEEESIKVYQTGCRCNL